jgi:hypothetical protein
MAVVDDELVSIAKTSIGAEFGLSPAQSARLRGDNARALRHDAQEMRRELGLDPTDDRERDEQGRFASKKPTTGEGFNAAIRRAAGRTS